MCGSYYFKALPPFFSVLFLAEQRFMRGVYRREL